MYTNTTDSSVKLGDPFIVYDETNSKFYAYGTTGQVSAKGFYVYESTDLTTWSNPKTCFRRDPNWEKEETGYQGNTWCTAALWAPEVIYDEDTHLYYMFYSAKWGDVAKYYNDERDTYYFLYASVATCATPNGTFTEYSSASKTTLEPLICFEDHYNEIPVAMRSTITGRDGKTGFIKVIDASPFVDPVSGKKYLYLIADGYADYTDSSFVMAMEMEDWVTPKYETLTRITTYGKTTPGGSTNISEGQKINEGCSVYYHDGYYYLTFSTYSYQNTSYQVRQAISTNPLGTFTKVQPADGGVVIKSTDATISQSTGHSSFLQLGNELYVVYHAYLNDTDYEGGRRPALDKATFVDLGNGVPVLKVNGPTTTPQIKPEILTGYKNIAPEATITTSIIESDKSYLNDDFIPLFDNGYEYVVSSGKTTITLSFDSYKEIQGILVYNSKSVDYRFSSIETISLNCSNKVSTYSNLAYDASAYERNNKDALDAALILNCYGEKANTITITFNEDDHIAIPEIIVLGK